MRDPRIEPKVGDHVRNGKVERTVIAYHDRIVEHYIRTPNGVRLKMVWITTWQDWCRNAEVLHVA